VLLVTVLGSASAQSSGTLSISGAETASATLITMDVNVIGTGVCAAAAVVDIQVTVTDEVTGGIATGLVETTCQSAGDHINWLVTANGSTAIRAGDKALVVATATGGIDDQDQKEATIKQYH
jgi:hypothetical protein